MLESGNPSRSPPPSTQSPDPTAQAQSAGSSKHPFIRKMRPVDQAETDSRHGFAARLRVPRRVGFRPPREVRGSQHAEACCCTGPGGPVRGRRSDPERFARVTGCRRALCALCGSPPLIEIGIDRKRDSVWQVRPKLTAGLRAHGRIILDKKQTWMRPSTILLAAEPL